MKKLLLLLLISSSSRAQDWVDMMNDHQVNFYEVQHAFNQAHEKQLRKEKNLFRKIFRWSMESEKESPGLGVYRRWEFFNQPRVYPSGNRIRPDHLWNEYKRFSSMPEFNRAMTPGSWTSLGPTSWLTNSYNPGLGRVNAIAVDPVDPQKLYIGAPAGGIWKSPDGGVTWQLPTTDHLPSIGVSAIAIDYTDTDIIYIGTGDANAGDSYSTGVLKSTDGGQTWNQTGLSFALTYARKISKILMDPADHLILYAATNNGIYKTTDGGATWSRILTGVFRDMEFKPDNSNVIYASGNSFVRSLDAGVTFTTVTSGLPASADVDRYCIAVTAADSNYIYVAAAEDGSSGFQGLYRSTDGGNTFNLQSDSPNLYGWAMDGNDGGGQGWYSMTLCASPFNAEEVFTGGVNIWGSSDGGVTWEIKTHWYYGGPKAYVHADQHWMEYIGNTIYVGCDGGIFSSDDNALTWTDRSFGLAITQFYRLGGTETDPGMLMAGAQDNGCNLLKNGQWTHVLGADGMEVAINPQNTQNIFAESQNGGIARSTNGGVTMTNITGSISETGEWVTPFMLDPLTPAIMYAGFENVWQSLTNGLSWAKISNFSGSSKITFLNVSEADPAYIYIIRANTLFVTDDGGFNWYNRSAGLPVALAAPTSVAIHPQDAMKIWVTFSGTSGGNKVYSSADAGLTWTNESMNLPNIPVNHVVYQNGTADGLYIATDMGVFYKDDSLSGWQPFWNGLPNVVVTELEINYAGQKLRAATYGRGIWESDLYQLSAPQALFTADRTAVCPGEEIHFTDQSLEAYPSWQWSFPGGNPSSSALQHPAVTYSATGSYDVQLIVQNPAGSDTLLKTLYITAAAPASGSVPIVEDFESGSFPPTGWSVRDDDGVITWTETNTGGFGNSQHSAFVPNFNNNVNGQKEWLMTPVIDVTQLTNPWLKFDRAYARIPGRNDSLNVFFTTDCGVTRTYIYGKAGMSLSTAGVATSYFAPTPVQWASDSLSLSMITGPVQIGFESRNGNGNNLYIDNINIYNAVVSVDEKLKQTDVMLSPNPAHDRFSIEILNGQATNAELKITDVSGRTVHLSAFTGNYAEVPVLNWNDGLYIVELQSVSGNILYSGKLQVRHP